MQVNFRNELLTLECNFGFPDLTAAPPCNLTCDFGLQVLIHHSFVETDNRLLITAGFKWLLFSARNHSICSAHDLFDWPSYLFTDILDTGQVFLLTLPWRFLCVYLSL